MGHAVIGKYKTYVDIFKSLSGGGSGFIGTALNFLLLKKGFKVTIISRQSYPNRLTWNDIKLYGLPDDCTAVINLAGKNVLDPSRMWTSSFRDEVRTSRISTTLLLANAIQSSSKKPHIFISMSGVGYYKPSVTQEYSEDSPGGNFDFISTLAYDWENAAKLPTDISTRCAIIRSGVVLARHGGMIQKLFLPFYLGLGGPVGNGNQWFPWIHLTDLIYLIYFIISNPNIFGIFNGVAPEIITNLQFSKAFSHALGRPSVIKIPPLFLETVFGKERAMIMTEGQKVIPQKAVKLGFCYRYPNILSACHELAHLLPSVELYYHAL